MALPPAAALGKIEPAVFEAAPAPGRQRAWAGGLRSAVRLGMRLWLGAALLATLLLATLLGRLPDAPTLADTAELGATGARLAALPPGQPASQPELRAELLRRVAGLQGALRDDRLPAPELDDLEARVRALPPLAAPAELAATGAAAERTAAALRTRLESRQAQTLVWLQGLAVLLALLLLVPLHALWRQQRRMSLSMQHVGRRLGSGDWHDAVQTLREGHLGAGFDALASGVEDVLGAADRRWRALADLSADWFWETDAEHRLSWLSGSSPATQKLGWAATEVIGRRRDELQGLDPPAEGWDAFHGRLQRHEPFRDVEFRARPRQGGGDAVWVSISGRPRRDAHGNFLGYEGVGRDISERKAAHDQMAASEQRWSLMTGLASDWYWETDAEHRLLPLAAEFNGRFPQVVERAVGHTRWDAYRQALSAEEWAAHRAMLDARRPFRSLKFEVDVGRGHRLWLSISGIPRFDAQGAFIGYHGVGRDITVRKHAERLLERHNQELQRAVAGRTRELQQLNRDLDAFSRQLAHELRTPIGHVEGLAQLLEARTTGRLADDERQLIALQVQAAHSMRDTVDALMQLARSAVQPMPMERVDISHLAAQVLAELPRLERRAEITWHIEPGLEALGSPAALRIVLSNLMGNAAKFTRKVERPSVRISGRHDPDGRLRVTVQDNGAGFDPALAARLFVPFNRLHQGQEFHGTGIGLSIVQRIVERHGGTVAAHGDPGLGARFEFTLAPPGH